MGTDSLFQTGFDFSDALDEGRIFVSLTGLARSANTQQDRAEEQRYAIAPAFAASDDKTNFTFSLTSRMNRDGARLAAERGNG